MLMKFVAIRNVGTFRDSPFKGDCELRKLTLVHADNGRGKTTLCAILRSLRTGEPRMVLERKTIKGTGEPEIHLRLDSGDAKFKGGAWTAKHEALDVFDSEFVTANVFSGEDITNDHKRNFCRIVLGAAGVKMAELCDTLDGQVREAHKKVKDADAAIEKLLLGKAIPADKFLKLAADPDIDDKIAAKKAQLAAVKDSAEIGKKAGLVRIALEALPETIAGILGKGAEGVSADAAKLVRAHMLRHKINSESWLQEGLGYVAEEECPFCAQGLKGSTLYDALKGLFGKAYEKFKSEVAGLETTVTEVTDATAMLKVQG